MLFSCLFLLFSISCLANEMNICKHFTDNDESIKQQKTCSTTGIFESNFEVKKFTTNFKEEINTLKQMIKDANKTSILINKIQTEMNLLNNQLQELEVCSSNPCINGNCSLINNNYYCSCKTGFTGKNCETEIKPCEYKPCINGICFNLNETDYNCTCHAGFTGGNCETKYNPCESKPCNNGNCSKVNITSYSCSCLTGYTGRNCETKIKPCQYKPCINGTCININETDYNCTCHAGFTGKNCETNYEQKCSVGMKAGDPRIQDSDITASTTWDGDFYPYHGRLHSQLHYSCWGPSKYIAGDWLQVDLKNATSVTGVVTQGCGFNSFWLTAYKIAYSNTTSNFTNASYGSGTEINFPGNNDKSTPVIRKFLQPITARYFRLIIQSFRNWPGVRMDYITC